MLRRALFSFFAFTGLFAAVACGGSNNSAIATNRCVPGEQDACACADGSNGVQICTDDGTFGACACSASEAAMPSSSSTSTSSSSSSGGRSTSSSGGSSSSGSSSGGSSSGGKTSSSGSSSSSSGGTTPTPDAGSTGTATKGSLADCQTGGNVLVLNGDSGDYIHPGYAKMSPADFKPTVDAVKKDWITFYIEPSGQQYGLWWDVDFSTRKLSKPLEVGTYLDAERAAFATYLKPGLDIGGDGRGCNTLSGEFTIHEITWGANGLQHIAATFEQHCEQGTAALRGCLVYDAP